MANTAGATFTGLHDVKLFEKTVGLTDAIDPTRIEEGGLAVGENVVVDITGAIRRRKGVERVGNQSCHSLFSCGSWGLGVFGQTLKVVENSSGVVLTSLVVVGDDLLSYVKTFDGRTDVIFFSSLTCNGKIINRKYIPWETGAYVGMDSTEARTAVWMLSPPKGQLVEIFDGRMFIAKENYLYVSEKYDYSRFKDFPFIFSDNITMLLGISTVGIFVGTTENIMFLQGSSPEEFSLRQCYSKGALFGSGIKVKAADIAYSGTGEVIVFSVSGEGICIGEPSGNVSNFTRIPVAFPEGSVGAAYINSDKQYIVSIGE